LSFVLLKKTPQLRGPLKSSLIKLVGESRNEHPAQLSARRVGVCQSWKHPIAGLNRAVYTRRSMEPEIPTASVSQAGRFLWARGGPHLLLFSKTDFVECRFGGRTFHIAHRRVSRGATGKRNGFEITDVRRKYTVCSRDIGRQIWNMGASRWKRRFLTGQAPRLRLKPAAEASARSIGALARGQAKSCELETAMTQCGGGPHMNHEPVVGQRILIPLPVAKVLRTCAASGVRGRCSLRHASWMTGARRSCSRFRQ